jgi:hypothetical protein
MTSLKMTHRSDWALLAVPSFFVSGITRFHWLLPAIPPPSPILPLAAFRPQPARRAPQSLSLGSLGVVRAQENFHT